MADFLSIIGEALALLVEAIATWAQALLQGLMVLTCFLFSPGFRAKKLETWRLHPRRKIIDLGLASLWFALVIGLPCFLLLPSDKQKTKGKSAGPIWAKAGTNEDLRIKLGTKRTNQQETLGTIVVKSGGVAKILGTKSLGDLKTQLVENVSFVRVSQTNVNPSASK